MEKYSFALLILFTANGIVSVAPIVRLRIGLLCCFIKYLEGSNSVARHLKRNNKGAENETSNGKIVNI